MIAKRRFARDRNGRFRTGLGDPERQLLKMLPPQALSLLETDSESTRRVFPVAYPDDEEAEAEYRQMMEGQLRDRHRRSLDTLAATVDSVSLDEEELNQWLDALEVLRLVLGTELDVSEDPVEIDDSDPRAPQLAVYAYLSMLQGEITESLSEVLPAATGDQEAGT